MPTTYQVEPYRGFKHERRIAGRCYKALNEPDWLRAHGDKCNFKFPVPVETTIYLVGVLECASYGLTRQADGEWKRVTEDQFDMPDPDKRDIEITVPLKTSVTVRFDGSMYLPHALQHVGSITRLYAIVCSRDGKFLLVPQ